MRLQRAREPLDTTADQISPDTYWPIHRDAPPFADLEPKKVMLETGIKVIDLLEPYVQVARSACSAVLASARP